MYASLSNIRLGILGGGQLGRMFIQEAINYNIYTCVMDPDKEAPCKAMCNEFTNGSITDFDSVYAWGKSMDLITIEIENVNVDALEKLEKEGVKVFPQPAIIRTIQDKGSQKEFYARHKIPTSEFKLLKNKQELKENSSFLPAVQKLRTAGYDGRGVLVLNSEKEIENGFSEPSLLEKKVAIDKELSVIVARNSDGEIKTFPAVEMEFHPTANLVEFLFSPAAITKEIEEKASSVALAVAEKLGIVGILAVELFLDKEGNILVNEIAPRPHNSGHQTIEANLTSQYAQLLRAILNLPLGSTEIHTPSVMVNLLGEPGHDGVAKYDGIEKVLKKEGVYLHLYGKKFTRPFRKMGHITVTDKSLETAKEKAKYVKQTLKVIS